jgi:hypothetical protein
VLFAAVCATGAARAQTPPEDDDVEIPAQPAPPSSAKPPAPPSSAAPSSTAKSPAPAPESSAGAAEAAALRRELAETQARLGARIDELEKRGNAAPRGDVGPAVPAPGASWLDSLLGAGDYALSAYLQAQYENHRDSQDQLSQSGAPLNQDRFLVRRGRLRLDMAFPFTELTVELDGNTTRGPSFGLRRAEASLVLRPHPWNGRAPAREQRDGEPPLAMLTFGLSEMPFGFELSDSSRNRVFMERSQASLAFFPGEADLGIKLWGGVGFFRYALAVVNGEPLNDASAFSWRDPNASKDLIARVGVDATPHEALRVSGGVSALYGRGFHAGTPATKGGVQWRDLNENAVIDPGEITPLPASAATPSANFERWAIGLDVQLRIRTPIGTASFAAEAGVAKNLDRGLFVADPVAAGTDARHLYYHASWVQEVTRWGLAGFRAEAYDPNADFLDNRVGKLVPTSEAIHTFSPIVGLTIPGRARLLFQYDVVLDSLGRDARGVPADLDNNRFTVRLQLDGGTVRASDLRARREEAR